MTSEEIKTVAERFASVAAVIRDADPGRKGIDLPVAQL
jgi:hypothetical protein